MNSKIRYILVFALLLAGSMAQAQLPTTGDYTSRLGTKDPAQAKKLYGEFFSPTAPITTGAPFTLHYYEVFDRLRALAPYFSYTLYSGYLFEETKSNPNPMFVQLIHDASDPSVRMMYVQDVLDINQNAIDNLDSINALRQTDNATRGRVMSEALARIKYAHYFYKFCSDSTMYPAKLYNKEEAYNNYRNAFRMMLDQKKDISDEIEGNYLYEYFNTCYDLYKSDNEKYYTQFLEDYLEIIETCDNLLIPYYDVPDSIRLQDRKYVGFRGYRDGFADIPGSGIVNMFKESGAGDPTRLDAFFSEHLKDHRTDQAYLNKAIHLMMENGGSSTNAFYDYCEASYAIQPTYENSLGCALLAGSMNQTQEKIDFFLQAKKYANNDLQRGVVSYLIGTSTSYNRPEKTSPQYAVWEKDMLTSNANLQDVIDDRKALQESTSLDIREYPALASFAMGMNSYRMGGAIVSIPTCNKAIEQFKQAKALGLTKYDADAMIANVKNTIATINKNNAAAAAKKGNSARDEARRKAYNEYLAKQKAEEDFWKGGRR